MKTLRPFLFLSSICTLVIISSCENETSEIEKVTFEERMPVESTKNSKIIYSENAEKKIEAFAPVMHRYTGKTDYNEMPEGVEVIFYDSADVVGSKLTANYAIDKQSEFLMEAKYNVIIINAEGEELKTEHLIWDRKDRRIYSKEHVTITTDDEVIMGEGFESNETFTKYKILKPTGTLSQEDEQFD